VKIDLVGAGAQLTWTGGQCESCRLNGRLRTVFGNGGTCNSSKAPGAGRATVSWTHVVGPDSPNLPALPPKILAGPLAFEVRGAQAAILDPQALGQFSRVSLIAAGSEIISIQKELAHVLRRWHNEPTAAFQNDCGGLRFEVVTFTSN